MERAQYPPPMISGSLPRCREIRRRDVIGIGKDPKITAKRFAEPMPERSRDPR